MTWLSQRILGLFSGPERQTKTEKETRTVTSYYTVYHATMTYPDGETENVEYTKGDFNSDEILLYDHDADSYTCYVRDRTYGKNFLRLGIDRGHPRRFSLYNIRDMDIDWTEELVAVAEVEVDATYERLGDDGEWEQCALNLKSGHDTPDITVWSRVEWESRNA